MATIGNKRVIVDTGPYTLEGFVACDCDFDTRFRLEEEGTGEILYVNGWLADNIEVLP